MSKLNIARQFLTDYLNATSDNHDLVLLGIQSINDCLPELNVESLTKLNDLAFDRYVSTLSRE
jgi:hypothetical protein